MRWDKRIAAIAVAILCVEEPCEIMASAPPHAERQQRRVALGQSMPSSSSSSFPSPNGLHRMISARRTREFWMDWARGGAPNSWMTTTRTAAIRKRRRATDTESSPRVQHVVSAKTKEITKKIQSKLPPPPPKDDTGFFYGFTINMLKSSTTDRPPAVKKPSMKESVALTLDEIRTMRLEMEELRKELQALKQELAPTSGPGGTIESPSMLSGKEVQKLYNEIGQNVERWAYDMLKEGEEEGWSEVKCNKVMRKTLNPEGTTTAHLKWMKDSRGPGHCNPKDDREYPCLKCSGVIDAPLEAVCLYLAEEENLPEYNDLVETHKDLQEVTPSSKICLGQTPQILFIKPRTLITYCQHKWLTNGSQIIVNQACRHPSKMTKENMKTFLNEDEFDSNRQPMAFALRGANYIHRDPSNPNKTRLTILAHGNPGKDVPTWAMKTACGALANLEPFKLYYKINEGVQKKMSELQRELDQQHAQMMSTEQGEIADQKKRPGGMSQLGYACFWPHGGGKVDKASSSLWGVKDSPAGAAIPPTNNLPASEEDNETSSLSTALGTSD